MNKFEDLAVLEYRTKQLQRSLRKTTFMLAQIDEEMSNWMRDADEAIARGRKLLE